MRRTTTLPVLLLSMLCGSFVLAPLGRVHAQATLLHSVDGPGANARLGSSISISGTRVATGASGAGGGVRVYDIESDRLVHRASITTPAGATASFGQAVAIDGDRLFVCDTDYDGEGGAIYAYRLAADGTWALRQTIEPAESSTGQFCVGGMHVRGDLMATAAFYFDRFSDRMGRVFVFRRGADDVWREVLFVPPPLTSAGCGECQFFGIGLAFDGRRLAATDLSRNTAYVWDLVVTPTEVTLGAMRAYPGATWRSERWGSALALVGPNLVVGSDARVDGVANAGAVDFLVEDGTATAATRIARHDAPTPHGVNDFYGQRLAQHGEHVAAASNNGFVYLHRRGLDGSWASSSRMVPPGGSSTTSFGSSVALHGEYLVIGESGHDSPATNAGRLHLYRVPVRQFVVEEIELPRPPGPPVSAFGVDTSVDRADSVAAVADDRGTNLYALDLRTRSAALTQVVTHVHPASSYLAHSVDVADGTLAVADQDVGDGRGDVTFYERMGDTYDYASTSVHGLARMGGLWGYDLTRDGDRIVVGAPYAGLDAWITVLSRTSPVGAWSTAATIDAPDDGQLFGFGVDIEGDTIVAGCIDRGCPGSNVGAAFVFRLEGGTLREEARIVPPAISSGGVVQCGARLALEGEQLAIGCRYDSGLSLTRAGAVFVYERTGTRWSEQPTRILRPTTRASNAAFGDCVEFEGSVVAVTQLIGAGVAAPLSAYIDGTEVLRHTLASAESAQILQVDGNLYAVGSSFAPVGGVSMAGRAYVLRAGYPDGALCGASAECLHGRCEGFVCVGPTPLGTACTTGDTCVSGECSDGVCCDRACDGTCEACGAMGVCEPIAGGLDPADECVDSVCGAVSCNGANACEATPTCDAGGLDAGTDAATAMSDAGPAPDAFVPPGVDAGGRDAAGGDTATSATTAPRVPLSCTCTAPGSDRPRGLPALLTLTMLALLLGACRRRLATRAHARALGLSIVLVLAPLAAHGIAHAQTAAPTADDAEAQREARARFELGHAHYDAGRYVEAAAEFERAYALTHRAGLLYNLHLSYQFAGNMPEATRTLRLYLETATDIEASVRRALERRLAAAEAALAARGTEPSDARPEPVEGTVAGEPDATETTPSDTEGTDARVEAPLEATPTSTAQGTDTAGSGLPIEPGIAVLAVGGATLLASAVLGGLALGAQSERDAACSVGVTGMECPLSYDQRSAVDRFVMFRDSAWALGIVGGVMAAAGVVLLVIGATDDTPATPTVACGPDGCVAGAVGRF